MAEGNDEDRSSKTEEPTPRKLQKAREKGDVPASRETGTMMMVMVLLGLTIFLLPQVLPQLIGVLARVIESAGTAPIGEGSAGLEDIGVVAGTLSRSAGIVLAPVLGVLLLGAVFGVAIQGETVAATERLKPKLSKISPISGFKKLVSPDALVEFGKSVLKVLFVGGVAVWLAYEAVTGIWLAEGFLPEAIITYVQTYVGQLLAIVAVMTVVVALADVIFKRYRWLTKQRMTVKEIRDEFKEQEGDPLIKGKRMEIRRKRARQRIAAAVPEATVVLTNPTHFAVALRYTPGADEAPVCTAKGTDLMAAHIRRLAHEAEVPVVENRPLARALYQVAEVDEKIPLEHWKAVAEIIGFVLDIQRNIRRKPPEGSSLRAD